MRRSKRCIACSGFFFAEAPSPFFSVYVYVLFLSVKEKEPNESSGTRLSWPAALARQRDLPSLQKIFCGAFLLFSSVLFLSVKEKEPKKKAQEPAWVDPLRPPVSGTYLPRRKKQKAYAGGGPPDCFRASPPR